MFYNEVYVSFINIHLWMDANWNAWCTVPKVIDFPRYNMKCSRESVILRGIFHVVSRFLSILLCYIAEILNTFGTVCGAKYDQQYV